VYTHAELKSAKSVLSHLKKGKFKTGGVGSYAKKHQQQQQRKQKQRPPSRVKKMVSFKSPAKQSKAPPSPASTFASKIGEETRTSQAARFHSDDVHSIDEEDLHRAAYVSADVAYVSTSHPISIAGNHFHEFPAHGRRDSSDRHQLGTTEKRGAQVGEASSLRRGGAPFASPKQVASTSTSLHMLAAHDLQPSTPDGDHSSYERRENFSNSFVSDLFAGKIEHVPARLEGDLRADILRPHAPPSVASTESTSHERGNSPLSNPTADTCAFAAAASKDTLSMPASQDPWSSQNELATLTAEIATVQNDILALAEDSGDIGNASAEIPSTTEPQTEQVPSFSRVHENKNECEAGRTRESSDAAPEPAVATALWQNELIDIIEKQMSFSMSALEKKSPPKKWVHPRERQNGRNNRTSIEEPRGSDWNGQNLSTTGIPPLENDATSSNEGQYPSQLSRSLGASSFLRGRQQQHVQLQNSHQQPFRSPLSNSQESRPETTQQQTQLNSETNGKELLQQQCQPRLDASGNEFSRHHMHAASQFCDVSQSSPQSNYRQKFETSYPDRLQPANLQAAPQVANEYLFAIAATSAISPTDVGPTPTSVSPRSPACSPSSGLHEFDAVGSLDNSDLIDMIFHLYCGRQESALPGGMCVFG
jgi:hypothetical protein